MEQKSIDRIFIEAAQMADGVEQDAFVARECGDDSELRRKVGLLLQARFRAERFLESPPIELAVPSDEARITEAPGSMIGPYKLLEQIGIGGFGVVFMAEQHHPVRRKVALKVLKPGMDTRQIVARFEAERQALALMEHENIARVLDAGETASGRPYFVMELVRGVPITNFCDDNQYSVRQRLELFVSVCDAVQHAHQKGIIHRDLKPSNIMVTMHDGEPIVKVIDFGIAKATGQQLTDKTLFTNYAQLIGTPMYMSPEQAQLSALDVDTRTDIYSLGVLLYELLTGTTPFDKERLRTAAYAEIQRIIREEEPVRPSTRLSSLGQTAATVSAHRRCDPGGLTHSFRSELDWVVMKALEKDRKRRYDTASAFAADVNRYLRDETVLACPPKLSYRLGKLARRHKGLVVGGAAVLVALVAGIISTTWQMIRATTAQATAVQEATEKQRALATAQESERAAKDQLFLALWNQARAVRFSRQPGQRLDSLAALREAAQIRRDERLRDEAIAAMALPDVRRVSGWRSAQPPGTAMAYGGQYRIYARADSRDQISVRSIPDDREVQRIPFPENTGALTLTLSADERFLVGIGGNDQFRVWRVADGRQILQGKLPEQRAFAFSSDGRQFAVGQQGWVVLYGLATGQELTRWHAQSLVHAMAFSPDGQKLAVGYYRSKEVSVYDSASGTVVAELPVGEMTLQVMAWHPRAGRLAIAGSDPRIQIWDVAEPRQLATLVGHVQLVGELSFNPTGELLASHGWDGQLLLWDSATGRQLMRLLSVTAPQFDADGRLLAVVWNGDEAQLLEVTASREYRTLGSSAGAATGGYDSGDFSPDGRLIAVGMDQGTRLWDLPSGRELAALPAWTDFVSFDAHRPPGRETVTGDDCELDLLTCGRAGLQRWPMTRRDPEASLLRLGPPQLVSPMPRAHFTHTAVGETLAAVSKLGEANKLLNLNTGDVVRELGAHSNGDTCVMSADGNWAASAGWHSERVRLWNAKSGAMVHEWLVGKRTSVLFTPDSRELIISRGDDFSFWNVEELRLTRQLPRDVGLYPGFVAFSPDGKLMALEMAAGVVHLKEVSTARTVAKLEDPHGDRSTWLGFTRDGSELAVAARYASAVHLWNLRAIRQRLKEMDLDWDWPEFSDLTSGHEQPVQSTTIVVPEVATLSSRDPAGTDDAKPVKIQVVLTESAARSESPEQAAQRLLSEYRAEFEAHRDSAAACNALAWYLATAPAPLRNADEAVTMATRAVELDADSALYRNTLGVACYRAARYREAVDVLRPNLARQEDWGLPYDLYFLAMSHQQVGESDRARDYYDWAVRWCKSNVKLDHRQDEELAGIRAEAEETLGIRGSVPASELPAGDRVSH